MADILWKTRFEFGKNFRENFRNPGLCAAAIILQSDKLHTSGFLPYEHLFDFIWLLDSSNFAILHNLTFVKCWWWTSGTVALFSSDDNKNVADTDMQCCLCIVNDAQKR